MSEDEYRLWMRANHDFWKARDLRSAPAPTDETSTVRAEEHEGSLAERAKEAAQRVEEADRLTTSLRLSMLGVDAAVDLVVKLFGRQAVKAALPKRGAPRVVYTQTKHEIVWTLVETRRAARKQTVREACDAIARHGGIRDAEGLKRLSTKTLIEKAFYDADKVFDGLPEFRKGTVVLVQHNLWYWRHSGKTYDAFERGRLQTYRIAEKVVSPFMV